MTTREDIARWIENAPKQATHMIVVCDTFDYEDYPVYVMPEENVKEREQYFNMANMQKVMETIVLKPAEQKSKK